MTDAKDGIFARIARILQKATAFFAIYVLETNSTGSKCRNSR